MEGVAHINPQSMQIHVEGYGDMTEDVARELAAMRKDDTDRVARVVKARQAYLAREMGEAQVFKGGHIVAQVDEAVYQHWVDRYGQQFFSDKSNREYFLKKYPECRVRSRSRNPSIVIDGYRVNDRRSAANL